MIKFNSFSKLCRVTLIIVFLTSFVLPFPQISYAQAGIIPNTDNSELRTQCLDLSSIQPGTSVEGLHKVMEKPQYKYHR